MMLRELARGPLPELDNTVRESVILSVVAPDGGLDLIHQIDGLTILCRGCGLDSALRCTPVQTASCSLPPTMRTASGSSFLGRCPV